MGLSLEFTTVSVKIIMYYIKTYSIFKSARDNSSFLRWAPLLYMWLRFFVRLSHYPFVTENFILLFVCSLSHFKSDIYWI